MIVELADQIVTDYLRPVHDQAVTAFREAAALIPDNPSTLFLLRASDKVRETWLSLADAATRQTRTAAAALRLHDLTPQTYDVDGEFSMMRNAKEVWPLRMAGRTPPWRSDDPRLSLLWLVRHDADLWLPTAQERETAWWAKYGTHVQQQRVNRHNAQAFLARLQ